MAYYVETLILFLSCFFLFPAFSSARDNMIITQFLKDPETLESNNAIFKFGFFSPGNSTYRYAGIWYKNKSDGLEVVWVANRENPLNHSSGVLRISADGNLQLFSRPNKSIWSTNVAVKDKVIAPVLQLLDTGNLVLLSNISKNIMWQSFDHSSGVWLPHMKVDFDENMNTSNLIASWKSPSDPSLGRFRFGITHRRRISQLFVWDGDRPYWQSGPWDGHVFMGVQAMYYFAESDGIHLQNDNNGTLSLSFSSGNDMTEHYILTYDGILLQKDWEVFTGNWMFVWQSLQTDCDMYGKCGEFGTCNSNNSPICSCLKGFEPRNKQEWSAGNWSSGCVRRTPLLCGSIEGEDDGFLRLRNMKVPDYAEWVFSSNEEYCKEQCLSNCSCLSYAYSLGFGCMIWRENLIDIQEFSQVGVDLFIRLAHSELDHSPPKDRSSIVSNMSSRGTKAIRNRSKWKAVIAVAVIMGTAAIIVFLCILRRWMDKRHVKTVTNIGAKGQNIMVGVRVNDVEIQDLPLYKFEDLTVATNNFWHSNKLGQGGFGSVYKGKMKDGQEIAVKRLSTASGQGLQEFMNEVVVISKLQHRNLVRLLGCCVEGDEKLLVYEYMPNKSLDAYLFGSCGKHLDWKKRFDIIKGISRGLLYLHRDSRLKIIHRDLKASNILLDKNLDPKISDFGMARIFGGNQDQGDTNRVVGTYGYMSPEYAMKGRFSDKSDVFSFGVLLLEIVSGRRNNCFIDEETLSLLAHAWKLWNENSIMSIVDQKLRKSSSEAEILKCIQLGLLCVQEFPEDRPAISMVVSMFGSEATYLPQPTQPGFTQRKIASPKQRFSVNDVSFSSLIAR